MIPIEIDDLNHDAQQPVTGADTITSYQIRNRNFYTIYVKLYDKLADDIDITTDVPDEVITVEGLGKASDDNLGFDFSTALSMRCTAGSSDDDNSVVSVTPVIQFNLASGGGDGIGGSISDHQVAFGNGTDIAGSSLLTFDGGTTTFKMNEDFDSQIAVTDQGDVNRIDIYGDEEENASVTLTGGLA